VTQGQVITAAGESGTPTFRPFEVCGVLHFEVYRAGMQIDLGINFRNADGPLDALGGLVTDASYTALPFVPPVSRRSRSSIAALHSVSGAKLHGGVG
jgi:hypothetical protein